MGASEQDAEDDAAQVEQFVVMLGSCMDSARLAGLPVRVELDDGSVVEGIPSASPNVEGDDTEFDHSGMSDRIELDGTTVVTTRVRSYAVTRVD